MSNIIPFVAQDRGFAPAGLSVLMNAVAVHRWQAFDVRWYKENAELLSILVATGAKPSADALDVYAQTYAALEETMRFFPQYYRFLLSICLDLEDLGMHGDLGQRLCLWAAHEGLVETELSDLQRAEAIALLARRGVVPARGDGPLIARLHQFAERSATFALPNRKAAYELTHLVFYLSGFGQCDPGLAPCALTSLEFAGVLAYLDQDTDLLAEICTALRFAGKTPSAIWESAVRAAHLSVSPTDDVSLPMEDGFHLYLVTGWASHVSGRSGFDLRGLEGARRFATAPQNPGVLRSMSERLLHAGPNRSAEWPNMRNEIMNSVSLNARNLLLEAEKSTPAFDAFFARFARAETI